MFHHDVGPIAGGLNLVMLLAFGLSVAVQHNDPDPWLWATFYALPCIACLGFHFGHLHWQLSVIIGGLGFAVCIWLMPQFIGNVSPADIFASLSMKTQSVEEAREAGGSLLVALWMGFLSWHIRNRGNPGY